MYDRIFNDNDSQLDYNLKQNNYWKLCKEKKGEYYDKITKTFESVKHSTDFWKAVNILRSKQNTPAGKFNSDDWVQYFSVLLNPIVNIQNYSYLTIHLVDDYLD